MQEQEPINPYQSPLATDAHPQAAEWLATPSASLSRVARGLGIVHAGIIVALLGVIGKVAAAFVTLRIGSFSLASVPMMALVGLGGAIYFVGCCFCLSVPEETGARRMIHASVGATLAAFLLGVAEGAGILPARFHIIQTVLEAAAAATFLLFLARLGRFIGRKDLPRRARWLLFWGAVLLAAAMGPRAELSLTGSVVASIYVLSVFVGWLILFVSYVNLITATRKAILGGGRAV